MGEVLLKGTGLGDDPVAIDPPLRAACFPVESSGDDKNLFGQVPGLLKGPATLVYVFDDVNDVAEVHDLCLLLRSIRGMSGVPTSCLISEISETADVAPSAAPEVEECRTVLEQSIAKELLNGTREERPGHGGPVAGNEGHWG